MPLLRLLPVFGVHMRTNTYVYIHVCYIYIHNMYACMYICIYIYMFRHVRTYILTCRHTHVTDSDSVSRLLPCTRPSDHPEGPKYANMKRIRLLHGRNREYGLGCILRI